MVMALQNKVNLFRNHQMQQVRSDIAVLIARTDADLVHADNHPFDRT
jgi:hypothetical protein